MHFSQLLVIDYKIDKTSEHVPVSPSTATADAINDNRFIVVIDLIVIWDYSHQKGTKVQPTTPKAHRRNPQTALRGCNSKTI